MIDIEIETSESSIAPWSHENILLPEGTRETPLDVDNLQIVLARCSMTPDIGDRKSRARRSMKVGSPLTPPNTVRLHRKFAATDPKTLFQELGVIPPTRISSSSIKSFTQQDNAGFENARAAVEKRISTERIQPRLVARKICLPHVGPTWPFSNQPIDWGHENIRQFRSNIEKDIRNTRLVDPDGRKMSWAPWSPFTFVPDHFWARFVTLIPETIPQFEVIPKPLDPRTLVHLSEDEDDIEDLRPADFSHIDELSVLVRKRRGENIRHQNDKLAKDSFNKIDDASGVMENPFSDLGFRLLVNKKTKFEKLGHRKHLSKGAERVLKPVLPQEEVQIGLGSLKSVPNIAPHPVVSIKELQLVVTSSGILTRHVMRCLRKLVVDVKDVERDFAASFHMGGTKTNDADILVSPTVGIILSSAPEIQQQPLPGSKTMSKIRTRIVKLAHKFEKLYILVKTDGSTTFIYQGITDIINFSKQHGLACGTVIEILLCVGEEEQARQVLTIAESHSPSTDSFSLMDEVSRGELWLRKEADLNTYAAQALLELMISIFQVNREEGLTTLRRMTDEDRIQRLIPFVGEKCITRLNLALSRFQQDFLEMELRAREMYD